MADFDVIKEVGTRLRSSTLLLPSSVTLNVALGGRFFAFAEVPPDALFPRCMTGKSRRKRLFTNYPAADGGRDTFPYIEVLFATTTAVSQHPTQDIEDWDALATEILNYSIAVDHLVVFRRVDDIDPYAQDEDRTRYIVGGGLYEAPRQYG